MKIINQYSMLWSGLFIILILALFLFRKGFTSKDGIKLLLAGFVLVGVWLVLRPEKANTSEYTQFQAELGQGQAVLLEMQSPF